MPRILLVEDSKTFASLLKRRIKEELGFEVVHAPDMQAMRRVLARDTAFDVALLDLNLPDAENGQCVDEAMTLGLPTIVFTGEDSDDLKDHFWSKAIVDFVQKDSRADIDYVMKLIRRVCRNPHIKVLVVDDSSTYRKLMTRLLSTHRYQVIEASGGQEALAKLAEHPDVRLLVSDFNMPDMDGLALTQAVRTRHPAEELAILAVSSLASTELSTSFLKKGANDTLRKPFTPEDFYCRVTQNIELLEYIERIKTLANTDYLTGLANRRHFFTQAEGLFRANAAGLEPLAVAILDLDHFKEVNDSYGHDIGDIVLVRLAEALKLHFPAPALTGRIGGEEFALFLSGPTALEACDRLEALRLEIAENPVSTLDGPVTISISAGLCVERQADFAGMLKAADVKLYEAKLTGRNRICL